MNNKFVTKTSSHNAEGWHIALENVDLFVTEEGAQIAPVTFHIGGQDIEPYHLSPWQDEDKTGLSGALKNLRGEIFCMPFGGNAEEFQGERHPAHGEVSGDHWHLISASQEGDLTEIQFGVTTNVRKAEVVKTITVNRSHPVLYFSHKISGASGPMPLGHHPIVKMPGKGERMYLAIGNFKFGMTCPGIFSDPEKNAYQTLARGAEFDSIECIPSLLRDSETLDYSVFPSPCGFTDLFSVFKKPNGSPAWVAAVYPDRGYLWFALKDPAVLPSTTIWVSNSGRFFKPWDGRTRCIGIEDTCSFFANGLRDSAEPNFLNQKGFPTAIDLSGGAEIRHIQGVVPIPKDFGKIGSVSFQGNRVTFLGIHGKKVFAPVDYNYVMTGKK